MAVRHMVVNVVLAMKRKGAYSSYNQERDEDLIRAYRQKVIEADTVVVRDIFDEVVNSPASRFYVSERRAAIVISYMLQGRKVVEYMSDLKREMYNEIYRRVLTLMKERGKCTLSRLVSEVVNSPAPKFYLTPGSAKVIYYRSRNRWFERQKALARRQASLAQMWRGMKKG